MVRKIYNKRKTKKKKARKKKKKHLNAGAFFAIAILVLLAFIIYEFYLNEQQKKKMQTVVVTQVEKQLPTPKVQPIPTPQQSKKSTTPTTSTHPTPTKSAPSKKKKPATQAPHIPEITNHTNLAYPVSYSANPEQLIFHTGHAVSYNYKWKIPNWVSYELTADKTVGTEKRTNKFIPDPFVKGATAIDADYRNSGYDRGHMAPAADMRWCASSMIESFYFSNICPQHPKLNRKRWKELEDKVRDWARTDSAIIVICGPIVNENPECIGSSKVVVPHSFFKVVLSPHIASPKAIGFIFDNAHCTAPLRSHIVTVDSVEAVTGLDFFSPLPDHIEDILEAYVDTLHWGL